LVLATGQITKPISFKNIETKKNISYSTIPAATYVHLHLNNLKTQTTLSSDTCTFLQGEFDENGMAKEQAVQSSEGEKKIVKSLIQQKRFCSFDHAFVAGTTTQEYFLNCAKNKEMSEKQALGCMVQFETKHKKENKKRETNKKKRNNNKRNEQSK
jgi:hypothetical protein